MGSVRSGSRDGAAGALGVATGTLGAAAAAVELLPELGTSATPGRLLGLLPPEGGSSSTLISTGAVLSSTSMRSGGTASRITDSMLLGTVAPSSTISGTLASPTPPRPRARPPIERPPLSPSRARARFCAASARVEPLSHGSVSSARPSGIASPPCSASINAGRLGKRAKRSLLSARITAASMWAGMSGRSARSGSGTLRTTCSSVPPTVSDRNGRLAVRAWYSTSASVYWSAAGPTSIEKLVSCSGAMYSGLPASKVPPLAASSMRLWPKPSSCSRSNGAWAGSSLADCAARERATKNRLSGCRSRCKRSTLCAACSTAAAWRARLSASRVVRAPLRRRRLDRSSPSGKKCTR